MEDIFVLCSHPSLYSFISYTSRVLAELKMEHVKVTQLNRELEYVKERGSGLSGTVVTSSSSFSDSDVRKLQTEIREKDEEISRLEVGLKSSTGILSQREEELEALRVKYKNASEELEHARVELETLTKEKDEADRLRDAPNEAAQKEIESLKSRLETTKAQLSDKKDELSTFEAKNRAMNIQVQESLREQDALEEKNTKLMMDLEKAAESAVSAKNELNAKAEEIASIQEELSSAKGEVKALKEEIKSAREILVQKAREAERFSSLAGGADAVKDQLAKKDQEIANLEQKIKVGDLTLDDMKNTIKERENASRGSDEKLVAAEKEMEELKGRLEDLNEENMKLINDIADALNAAGNVQEANAVKKKAEAARAAQDNQKGGFGLFRRSRIAGDVDTDDASNEEEDAEPVVADLDDAIRQLKDKNTRIQELEEAAEQHEEALLNLKSDLVRLNASYKDDDYLNKKTIERLRQENTMYAMQIQRMEQELAEYREMYQ